jgi:hypothetical protein
MWTVLRIRIRASVPIWPRDQGWVKIRIRIRDEQPGSYFRELRTIFWVKILKFFDADPGSGMEKFGSRIRDGKNSDPQHWLWVRNFAFLACTVPVVVLQSVYTFRPLMIVNCTDTRNGHQSDPLPLVARCHSFRFIFTLIEQSYNIYIYYS